MLLGIGSRSYDLTTRALVMGALEQSDDFEVLFRLTDRLVSDGADIVELGEALELEPVVPAVEALAARFDVPLSIRTWRAAVAEAAFEAGAAIGNDITGFADPDYLKVARRAHATVVVTHRGSAASVNAVCSYLAERARCAESAGITRDRLVIDAGTHLDTTDEQSDELVRSADRLASLGRPLMLSAPTVGYVAAGVVRGCRIVRTRDVKATRRICDVVAAVLEAA